MGKISEIMEKIEELMYSQFEEGAENVDTHEMGQVADIYKDLSMAKYYCALVEAMAESEYGVDYDYDGPKGFSTKYPDEFYRERDMDYPKKMYYTSKGANSAKIGKEMAAMENGNSERMRRTYMESKEMHGRNSDEMENLEMFLNSMDSDVTELYPEMTPAEKQMTRNKLNAMLAKVK